MLNFGCVLFFYLWFVCQLLRVRLIVFIFLRKVIYDTQGTSSSPSNLRHAQSDKGNRVYGSNPSATKYFHDATTQMALQQMKVVRLSSKMTQQHYLDVFRKLEENRILIGPSQVQELSLENFLQHHPTKSNGNTSPIEVNKWIKDMESIFDAKRCPTKNKLSYFEYLLSREVIH